MTKAVKNNCNELNVKNKCKMIRNAANVEKMKFVNSQEITSSFLEACMKNGIHE